MTETAARQKRTILITGGSGLIGRGIMARLGDRYRIVDLDIQPPEDLEAEFEFLETDLTDDDAVKDVLAKIRQQYGPHLASVLHLAAYYDFSGEPSPLYDELTVNGTRRLLRGLKALKFNVNQFVFSSSLLVMQPSEHGHLSELSATLPKWDYPRSKLEAEQVIREERDGISTVVLRIAGVYDEQCHSLPLSQQIARIYEKRLESYLFPGDATHGQAPVHLEDLVDWGNSSTAGNGRRSAFPRRWRRPAPG
jgi:nucleoside-diphosphate-sugar epimerase